MICNVGAAVEALLSANSQEVMLIALFLEDAEIAPPVSATLRANLHESIRTDESPPLPNAR